MLDPLVIERRCALDVTLRTDPFELRYPISRFELRACGTIHHLTDIPVNIWYRSFVKSIRLIFIPDGHNSCCEERDNKVTPGGASLDDCRIGFDNASGDHIRLGGRLRQRLHVVKFALVKLGNQC